MRTIGRFVIRPDKDVKALLMVGSVLADSDFKGGVVYEIQEILGELVIVEAGESCIPRDQSSADEGSIPDLNWNYDVNSIITYSEGAFVMTKKEYAKRQGRS